MKSRVCLFSLVSLVWLATLFPADDAEAQIYEGITAFTGGPASSSGTIWFQIRRAAGDTACATTSAGYPSGASAIAVAESIEAKWDEITDCFFECPEPIYCRLENPNLFVVTGMGYPFRCYASTNGTTWSEILPGSPFSFNGITMSAYSEHQEVPSLQTWGLITLVLTLVTLGAVFLARDRERRSMSLPG